MSAAATESSVFQRVLGERFDDLDPRLQRYFGSIPSGSTGFGRGVYDVAGSRVRVLRPVLAWMAWRRILFPEFAREVPFTVENTPGIDGTLCARRTFAFPARERIMEDTMSVVDGRLIDRLGRRRGLEVELDVVVHNGALLLTSDRIRLRLAGVGIPLPRLARVTVDERACPSHADRQLVDVRITSPLLGEIFRYSGSFTYGVSTRSTRSTNEGRSSTGA